MPARRSALVGLAAATALLPALAVLPSTAQAAPAQSRAAEQVLAWFDTTAAAVARAGSPVQAPSSALWATTWLAADRAVDALPGSSPFDVAALAGAAHDVLVARVPSAQDLLDRQLADTLATLPAGAGRDRAVQTGQAVAADVLAERSGDGLDVASVQRPYTPRSLAPGVWTTTSPGGTAVQAGLPAARTYLADLTGIDVGPPPALGSAAYRAALAEVRAYGRATGSVRSPEQSATASFWAASSLSVYTQLLRQAVSQLPGVQARTHLVAVFHEVTTDAQIAVYRQKYRYEHWRPRTAIAEAALDGTPLSDGDATTSPDPSWTPLVSTPLHPEYPSGHTGYAAAAAEVLTALAGEPAQPFTATGGTAATPAGARTFSSWAQVVQENVDARVWEGVHFRFSDDAGADLGRRVALAALGG